MKERYFKNKLSNFKWRVAKESKVKDSVYIESDFFHIEILQDTKGTITIKSNELGRGITAQFITKLTSPEENK